MRSPLQKLGLTQYEEKVYITLLQYGNLHAKEISTYSSVPKTAVYPTLKQLEEKRLITSFKGDTTQFEAIDPNISLLSLEEQKKQEIKDNTNLALSLAKEKYQKKKIVKKKEVVSLSVGKASSSAIYKEMLKNAQSTVYIIGWRAHTVGNKFSFVPELKKLVKKGIDVRLIMTGDSKNKQWELLTAYHSAGIKTRFTPLDNFTIVIVDGKECKITLKDKTLPQKFNLQVRDVSLAKAMEFYFLSVWKSAKVLNFKDKKII